MRTGTLWVIGIILMLVVSLIAQQKNYAVKLLVIHDGQKVSTPDEIVLVFKDHSTKVSIREGVIKLPIETVNSDKFTLMADIGNEHIILSNLPKVAYQSELWTIHLAERQYSESFQYAIPKETIVSKSCIITFTSLHHEGWFMTASQCRTPKE